MCGRYNIVTDADALIDAFEITLVNIDATAWQPRYNVAPSQNVPVVRETDLGRELVMLRWGLVPFWAKEPKIGYKMINARAETVSTKPAFRAAFKRRRCLIPATGFYEWKAETSGKQPFNICMQDRSVFAFAGLWEHWEGEGEQAIESCTIIVTEANKSVQSVHDRMPVIIDSEHYGSWLDAGQQRTNELASLLQPFTARLLDIEPVSKRVNSPKHDDPECLVAQE